MPGLTRPATSSSSTPKPRLPRAAQIRNGPETHRRSLVPPHPGEARLHESRPAGTATTGAITLPDEQTTARPESRPASFEKCLLSVGLVVVEHVDQGDDVAGGQRGGMQIAFEHFHARKAARGVKPAAQLLPIPFDAERATPPAELPEQHRQHAQSGAQIHRERVPAHMPGNGAVAGIHPVLQSRVPAEPRAKPRIARRRGPERPLNGIIPRLLRPERDDGESSLTRSGPRGGALPAYFTAIPGPAASLPSR